jgi:hypothetical protein
MRLRTSPIRSLLVLLSLAVVRMACGGGATVPTSTPVPPTRTPDPSAQVALNPSASASQAGVTIHVVGLDAASTPNAPLPSLGIACAPALVFAAPSPTSLNTAGVSQTRAYLEQIPETSDGYPIPSALAPPPGTLRWVAYGQKCLARLEVTNTTGQDLILVSAGVRLLGDPVVNTYHYSLVDLCSVRIGPLCGYPSAAPDSVYMAQVTLGPGSVGAEFSGPLAVAQEWADPTLYPPTFLLPSGATRAIDLTILPPANTPASLYRVVPELTIHDSATHTLVFSSLASTLVYSSDTQSTCYGVQGDQIVPDSQMQYDANTHAFCV